MNLNHVEVYAAPVNEKETISNLMHFYAYDFSEYMDMDIEEDGLYAPYPYLNDYWTEPDFRFPYLFKVNGKHAGFALVRKIQTAEKTFFSMAEFFVMKKYRRQGVGKLAAIALFDLHSSPWEVFQLKTNIPAQHFWNKVISEYARGQYTEHDEQGDKTQAFVAGR
ncbi:GNAT family N-acetyltransferase [Paenibacillus sp. EC2-1]|uniref:GNAT family N-acetyltransferase n=1 Tax=Paenibacillus sp. EC2-1 TaxID=3388665 RepID=UPI003BEF0F3C